MKQGAPFAVVYDITDNKERARVAKLLKGFGFRVQKSVFECRLSLSDRNALITQLTRLQVESGSIKIYRLYDGAKHIVIGEPMEDRDGEFAYVV